MEQDRHERRGFGHLWIAALCALAAAACAVALLGGRASETARVRDTVAPACSLVQTIRYARCGHEVTRRLTADKEYTGCTLAQMQEAFPDWGITAFSPAQIDMSRTYALFCPDHLVVMPDGTGVLGVYENELGEGYAFKGELDIPLSELPEDLRQTVHLGIGFSTMHEVESWLETFES